MKRLISPTACAAAILLSSVSIDAILAPVAAQYDVDFDMFHDQLAPYGDWVYSDRWGEVWIPTDVSGDFRPYDTDGRWVYTDEYGWMWVSDYEWGDIPFHYGRWVFDPDDGWMWIPGYVWSPAWVIWRSNSNYIGWMPMPPDRGFLGGTDISLGISFGRGSGLSFNFGSESGYYGYAQWYGPQFGQDRFDSLWVFVGAGHLDDRDFRRYRAPRAQYGTIINNTTNITNYTISNNYVVNKSVDPRVVQRASGHPVPVAHAAQFIKSPQLVTTANQGRDVQQRMRAQSLRGNGMANSAPKPSPQVVQSLSPKIPSRNGRPSANLYTRETVTKAPLPNKAGANPPSNEMSPGNATTPGANMMKPERNAPGGNANGMTGPGGATGFEREKQAPSNNAMRPSSPATTNSGGAGGNVSTPEMRHQRGNEGGANSATPGNQMMGPNAPNAAGPNGGSMEQRSNGNMPPANAGPGAVGPATTPPRMLQQPSPQHTQQQVQSPPKSGEPEKKHKPDESQKPQ